VRHFNFSREAPLPRRPHGVAPTLEGVHAAFVSHLIPRAPGSDAGLSAIVGSTVRVLRRAGVHAVARRAGSAAELATWLEAQRWSGARPVTHVVINTYGFLSGAEVAALAAESGETEFVVLNHSGQSFLHIDPAAMDAIKAVLDLQSSTHNVAVAGNNPRFGEMCRDAFGVHVATLPNLYDLDGAEPRRGWRRDPDPLRVGTFGALREAKNQSIAQQAALGMARRLGVYLEWHVLGRRFDSANHILRSRERLFANLPQARLIEHDWAAWHDFLKVVTGMDVLLMPSFDETFCCVVADGIRAGVPSVVGPAVEWAPRAWVADPHDPGHVMRVGLALLADRPGAVEDGRAALSAYVEAGTRRWIEYLTK
jgi:hypothetical protein